MIYELTHSTSYDYSQSVSLSHHVLRLQPRDLPGQRCLRHDVQIDPNPGLTNSHVDYFGNRTTFVTVEGAHRKLVIASRGQVEVNPPAYPQPAKTPARNSVP